MPQGKFPRICYPITKIFLEIPTSDAYLPTLAMLPAPFHSPRRFHSFPCAHTDNTCLCCALLVTVLWMVFSFHELFPGPFRSSMKWFLIWTFLRCDHLDFSCFGFPIGLLPWTQIVPLALLWRLRIFDSADVARGWETWLKTFILFVLIVGVSTVTLITEVLSVLTLILLLWLTISGMRKDVSQSSSISVKLNNCFYQTLYVLSGYWWRLIMRVSVPVRMWWLDRLFLWRTRLDWPQAHPLPGQICLGLRWEMP